MKKVILFFIVSFIIITFVIPLSSYAADIESGDIIKITKLTRRYERKINQGEQRYSLVMVGSFSKGDQITFKSNLTYEAYNIDSSVSELKGKDLVLVSFKGVEYVIIRDKNFERLGKGPTSSSGITGSVSGIGGGGSDGNNEEIFYESEDAGLEYDENASQSDINDAREEKKEEEENNDPDEIYTSQPSKDNEERTAGNSIDDLISDADDFVSVGDSEKIKQKSLQDFSNVMYNILLTIGVVVAVIVGAIIGVKLMSSGIDTKVEAKRLLIPYGFGCLAVFGAFAIWKIVVTILQGV